MLLQAANFLCRKSRLRFICLRLRRAINSSRIGDNPPATSYASSQKASATTQSERRDTMNNVWRNHAHYFFGESHFLNEQFIALARGKVGVC